MRVPRRDALLRPLLAAALSSNVVNPPWSRAAEYAPTVSKTTAAAKVTQRAYLDIRIIKRFDVEVLEDAAIRGRLTFNLFGNDAPKGTTKFLEFIEGTVGQFAKSGGGPAYSQAQFDRVRPGELIEVNKIAGLKTVEFAGGEEFQYMSRLVPLRPVLEANDFKHDARGLLTRPILSPGPEFGVTLNPTPNLDGSHEVIGQLDPRSPENFVLLAELEGLPYITGTSLEGEGTAANAVFQAQKAFFGGLSKSVGDTRAKDRTGTLLRRVEITSCGLL